MCVCVCVCVCVSARAHTQEREIRWGQPGKTRTTKRKHAAMQDPPFYCKQSKEDPQLDPYEKHIFCFAFLSSDDYFFVELILSEFISNQSSLATSMFSKCFNLKEI